MKFVKKLTQFSRPKNKNINTFELSNFDNHSKSTNGIVHSKYFPITAYRVLFKATLILHILSSLKYIILSHAIISIIGTHFLVLPLCLFGILDLLSQFFYDIPFIVSKYTTKMKVLSKMAIIWMLVDTLLALLAMIYIGKYVYHNVLDGGYGMRVIEGQQSVWAYWIFFALFCGIGIFSVFFIVVHEILMLSSVIQSNHHYFESYLLNTASTTFLLFAKIIFFLYNVVFLSLAVYSIVVVTLDYECTNCYTNCEDLDSLACMLPFPSSFYLKEDPSTVTGYRLNFGPRTLPYTLNEGNLDPSYFNELDGFSTLSPIVFSLRGMPSNLSIVSYNKIELSVMKNSTTLIINADTRELVPHFVDLDIADPKVPLMIMQPALPLQHATRYVVSVQKIVDHLTDKVIPPNVGFVSAISNSSNPRYQHFKTVVLPVLESLELNVSQVQLAWDFVTISQNCSLSVYEAMRDDALANYELNYEVVSSTTTCTEDTKTGRVVLLLFKDMPWYLVKDKVGGRLPSRTEIRIQKRTSVYVLLRIPCSVLESGQPNTITQFGHGLFTSRDEVLKSWVTEFSEDRKVVLFASNWGGMANTGVLNIMSILAARMNYFHSLVEQIWQGWVMWSIVARSMINSTIIDDPVFNSFDGKSVMRQKQPLEVTFYGISQGGILGGGYVASSLDIKRAVLGVPGTPFALILPRSAAFSIYQRVMRLNLPNLLSLKLVISTIQVLWDPAESAGWIHCMSDQLRPGTFKKRILIQDAPGDSLVTSISAHIMSRGYGAHNLLPSPTRFYGDNALTGPLEDSSAIVEWVYLDVPPLTPDIIYADIHFNTHNCVKREPLGQEQILIFLRDNIIKQTCGKDGCVKDHVCV